MKGNKPIYVIGHRNPDTDSICSAISYANFKRAFGFNAVAARCGQINNETKYALEYFKVDQPMLLADLYPRVKDVALECKTVVRQHDTLRHLGEVMRKSEVTSVPVTDSKGELVGIVTVGDLAKRYFLELGLQSLVDLRVRYRDIIQAVEGKVLVSGDENAFIEGNVRIFAGSVETTRALVKEKDIVLVGDRGVASLKMCLELGVAALIITGNCRVTWDVHHLDALRYLYRRSTDQSVRAHPPHHAPRTDQFQTDGYVERHQGRNGRTSFPFISRGRKRSIGGHRERRRNHVAGTRKSDSCRPQRTRSSNRRH